MAYLDPLAHPLSPPVQAAEKTHSPLAHPLSPPV